MNKTANAAQTRIKQTTQTTQPTSELDYRTLDEGGLSERMLLHDEGAWREFLRRYTPVLRHQINKVIVRARQTLLASDVVEDILGDLHLDLIEHDMWKIRVWSEGQRKAKFASWLGLIASQVAIDHVRRAASAAGLPAKYRRAHPDRDAELDRGAQWLGRERNAEHGVEDSSNKEGK